MTVGRGVVGTVNGAVGGGVVRVVTVVGGDTFVVGAGVVTTAVVVGDAVVLVVAMGGAVDVEALAGVDAVIAGVEVVEVVDAVANVSRSLPDGRVPSTNPAPNPTRIVATPAPIFTRAEARGPDGCSASIGSGYREGAVQDQGVVLIVVVAAGAVVAVVVVAGAAVVVVVGALVVVVGAAVVVVGCSCGHWGRP